jgi:hypothetical protein
MGSQSFTLEKRRMPNQSSRTTLALVLSAACAGTYFASLETPAIARRGDEGGVAGGGTSCSTAPSLVIGSNSFDTSSATASLTVASAVGCGAHTIFKVNYFSFTPATTGVYTISTCGASNWDTRLAVFTACGSNLVPVACNDDGCGQQSTVTRSLTAGTTYRVAVGGYNTNDGGIGSVNLAASGTSGSAVSDVIVGALPDISKYGGVTTGSVTTMAYAVGTTSCNIGGAQLTWSSCGSSNQHPFITQNIFRIKANRLEHLGMGWGKHGFTALQGTLCGTCQASGSGSFLGVGCSDPYSASLNGSQSGLGARHEVNAATGFHPCPYNSGMPSAPATIGRRINVVSTDLDPAQNGGAVYFVEAQYIHPGDAAAGTDNNNGSWRQMTVGALSSGAYTLTPTGNTFQQKNPIDAWKTFVPTVQVTHVDVPSDGRFVIGSSARDNGNGTWHYDYAIFNMNSHRSGQSFSVPLPSGAQATGIGFRDVHYHSGDPFSSVDWTSSSTSGAVTWSTQTVAQNANANALRFATAYTFWFDSARPPADVTATLGLFRTGTPGSVTFTVRGPSVPSNPADINGDGSVDGQDLATLLSNWGNPGSGDIDSNGSVDGADLSALLSAWS